MSNIKKYLYIGFAIVVLILFMAIRYYHDTLQETKVKLDAANKSIVGLNTYIDKTKAQLLVIRKLDNDYQEQLKNVQADNDKLRDSLANGTKRVYVKADCPVSSDTATASSTHATTTRLAEDARQDYLRLRLEIEQTRQQVFGLQNYIKEVCLGY